MKNFLAPILFFSAILSSEAQNYISWKSSGYVNNKFQNRSNWENGQIPENPVFNLGPAIIDFGNKTTVSNFRVDSVTEIPPGGGLGTSIRPNQFTFGSGAVGSQTLVLRDGGELALYGGVTQTFNSKIVLGENGGSGEYRIYGDYVLNGPVTGGSGGTKGDKMLIFYYRSLSDPFEFKMSISDGGSKSLGITLVRFKSNLRVKAEYTGDTILRESDFQLFLADALSELSEITLQDGSSLRTNGFDQHFGSLSLEIYPFFLWNNWVALDFGNGSNCDVSFADSRANAWDYTLNLLNFNIGFDTLRFGTSSSALTDQQLGKINLPGYTADLDQNGYVIFVPSSPVPEPGVVSLLILGGLAVALGRFGIRSGKM